MAGTVYLRTNKFEVKLEGITFKARDFESLCMMDFLFPEGKICNSQPIVGLDVMRHPRDPFIVLVLLCFGVGCVILRFRSGDVLPEPILKFLIDEKICFVGFGIPEKKDLFPFEELGLTKSKVDIGYLAAKVLDDPKYKSSELAELARKVLGVRKMVGLTASSSFERHEQIKCAICQLFVSTVIAMTLLRTDHNKKLAGVTKKSSFLKSLNSLPLLNEGWLNKFHKVRKKENKSTKFIEKGNDDSVHEKINELIICSDSDQSKGNEGSSGDESVHVRVNGPNFCYDSDQSKGKEGSLGDESVRIKSKDDSCEWSIAMTKKPLKGILKCPSSGQLACDWYPPKTSCPSTSNEQNAALLKRANSKGHNVSFKQSTDVGFFC